MTISEISIRNHVFAWMLMAALLIFGGLAFKRMGVSQLPEADFPNVTISVSLDGASPEVMEMNVVDILEGAVTSVSGINSITSTSRNGSAYINVEFNLEKNIDTAVQEIQSAINRVQRQLPTDIDPPSVTKSNSDDDPILWLAVTSDKLDRKALMPIVRDQIKDRFTTLDGVGDVVLSGYVDPNLRVWLKDDQLKKYQMTASDVISAIQREHSEKPGGRLETGDQEFNIRTLGEAPSLSDFENITISRRGNSLNYTPIPLKSVARIEDGTADIRGISRSQGKAAVGIGIKKQPGSNAVQVAKVVKQRVSELATQLPTSVQMAVRFDSTQFIEEAVSELNFTLIFSALLTALVCWLFLGSWSATVNVVMAIPTSVIGTFIVLQALGFTLNTFTLLGLSLAIGIVVDDSIMVLENIVRHQELGKNRFLAALDGSAEITLAALAATLAIVAIFLPVAFMKGVIGKYFLQFGVTLSIAVIISLLEALTLTPMRCSRFMTVEPRTTWFGRLIEKGFEKSAELYKKSLPWVLDHSFLMMALALVFCLGTFMLGRYLKQEFIPSQDQSRLSLRIQTPVGSSLGFTSDKVKEIENYFSQRPEVESYFSGMGGSQMNLASISLTLKPPQQRKLTAQQLMAEYRKDFRKIKEAKITIFDPSLGVLGGRRSAPVAFSIKGPDWNKLISYTQTIQEKMEATGLMTDVDSNYQDGMPEVQVIPDRVKAREYGVDIAEISNAVNVMMAGVVAGKYSKQNRRYDVRVSLPNEGRSSVELLKKLEVRNNRGELVPLTKVAQIINNKSLQSITREDRQRSITVRANVAPSSSQAEALKSVQKIAQEVLPSGYFAEISGSAKTFQESFSGLLFALLLGILVSYMVLASQFNSFMDPLTILMALPFSVSGAFIALFLAHQSLNVYSMIGLILLMGIVKKNSILLVEFANHMRAQGLSLREALIEACPIRLRPILMTSMATIAGAIPPALAIGPGAESRIPMALAVIGGVTVSTLLTLFIVPCVYQIRLFQTKKEAILQN